MPVQVLRQLRKNASHMAYNSLLYNWSLRGSVPDRLVVHPVDPWPGDADEGRSLCSSLAAERGGKTPEGVITGEQIDLCAETNRVAKLSMAGHWEPVGADPAWLAHMHSFTWLRDLRALGGEAARRTACSLIEDWIGRYSGWNALAWQPSMTGERVAMWIALYECFGASANEDFQDVFFDSLVRQARHLSRSLHSGVQGIDAFKVIKGLLYAGLAFEGYESWIEQSLDALEREIDVQILGDGAHISRSPAQLLQALQILLDVRMALASGDYPLPEKVQHAIDRMGPALRFFRYSDKHFALFNGTQEGDQELVDCVLAQANVRGKSLQSLPCAGYERVSQGRTLLMFDCGRSPDYPYDKYAHAAPLAFEMSYAKERLFVSCGSHPSSEDWQESLRATAAHCSATLDHRNACEIREGGHFARKVQNVVALREDSKEAILVEGSHDGYMKLNGVTHRRRLYLSSKGYDLRGEDSFTSSIGSGLTHEVAIRFHIHPRVMVSLVREGQDALLRLPSGIGWRFHHTGGMMALENSIYLGEGVRPRKTKQLVIYGQMTEEVAQIKWAVQREG